jgi:hypothetical protein
VTFCGNARVLLRKLRMPVVIARHGELLQRGICYIAEPSQGAAFLI